MYASVLYPTSRAGHAYSSLGMLAPNVESARLDLRSASARLMPVATETPSGSSTLEIVRIQNPAPGPLPGLHTVI